MKLLSWNNWNLQNLFGQKIRKFCWFKWLPSRLVFSLDVHACWCEFVVLGNGFFGRIISNKKFVGRPRGTIWLYSSGNNVQCMFCYHNFFFWPPFSRCCLSVISCTARHAQTEYVFPEVKNLDSFWKAVLIMWVRLDVLVLALGHHLHNEARPA